MAKFFVQKAALPTVHSGIKMFVEGFVDNAIAIDVNLDPEASVENAIDISVEDVLVKMFMMKHQDDAVISQANPVTATHYTALDTTALCRLIRIRCETTGGTVQNLIATLTVDGHTIEAVQGNPGSGTAYFMAQYLQAGTKRWAFTNTASHVYGMGGFLLEGHSVKVEVEVEWTVQPSPLQCRVEYAVLTVEP